MFKSFPLLISTIPHDSKGLSFRFLNTWTTHHQFNNIVQEVWDTRTVGRPIVKFANKLKALRRRLREWNKEVFGRVDQRIKEDEDFIMEEEMAFKQDPTELNKRKIFNAKQLLHQRLAIEEMH